MRLTLKERNLLSRALEITLEPLDKIPSSLHTRWMKERIALAHSASKKMGLACPGCSEPLPQIHRILLNEKPSELCIPCIEFFRGEGGDVRIPRPDELSRYWRES